MEDFLCTEEDFKTAMTALDVAAVLFKKVRIITFELMSNHIHMILNGEAEDCLELFERFKARLRRILKTNGRIINWDAFKADILSALPVMEKAFDDFRIADAVEAVMNSAKRSNKYIDETAPWALAKDEANKDRLSTVLYNLLEAIRIIAVELTPFMPDTSKAILEQINCTDVTYESILTFGVAKTGVKVGTATPLFNRIDAAVMLKEIEEEIQKKIKEAENAAEIEGIAKIGIEDFAKVDLRVAEITECEPVKKAKKLLKLTVFDGVKSRTVASGIAKWYKPEELIGKKIILVSNLKPATLCGIESQGMILAADCSDDDVKVIFVDGIPAGSKVR